MTHANDAVTAATFAAINPGLSRARALLDARYIPEPPKRSLARRWLSRLTGIGATPEALPVESGRWLAQLVHAARAQLVVTLGTADGLAAVWLAEALRGVPGGRGDRALIGFERDTESARHARDVLRRAGVSRHADIRCDSPARALLAVDVPIDLVLLLEGFDADAAALTDLLLPKLRPGASLVAPQVDRRRRLADSVAPRCTAGGTLQGLRLPIDGELLWLVKR
ncbi:MAG: class I SAM-dependent methyltransferase [Nevskia sp.]|nr:class I SAM-dependent methyltransferase [Nevskia sp.]